MQSYKDEAQNLEIRHGIELAVNAACEALVSCALTGPRYLEHGQLNVKWAMLSMWLSVFSQTG